MAANVVTFQGNIVRRPEFADTRGDTAILNFTVAHSRKYKDKEDVTFLDCVAYGKCAENIGKYFDKGDPILVVGRLGKNNWEDRDGKKRSKIVLTAEQFHFAGQTGGSDSRGGGSRGGGNSRSNNNNRSRNDHDDNRGGNGGYNHNDNRNQQDSRNDQGRNDRQDGGRGQQRPDDNIPF